MVARPGLGMIPPVRPRLQPTPEMVRLAREVARYLREAQARGFPSNISEETIVRWFAKYAERNIPPRRGVVQRIEIILRLHHNTPEEVRRKFVMMCGYFDVGDRYIPLSIRRY